MTKCPKFLQVSQDGCTICRGATLGLSHIQGLLHPSHRRRRAPMRPAFPALQPAVVQARGQDVHVLGTCHVGQMITFYDFMFHEWKTTKMSPILDIRRPQPIAGGVRQRTHASAQRWQRFLVNRKMVNSGIWKSVLPQSVQIAWPIKWTFGQMLFKMATNGTQFHKSKDLSGEKMFSPSLHQKEAHRYPCRSNPQLNYICFNEPLAVPPYKCLNPDMHGFLFATSIERAGRIHRVSPHELTLPWISGVGSRGRSPSIEDENGSI